MSDYLPNIPGANDLISDSQAQIQNNFSELNSIFNSDHWTWNTATTAYRGKHKKLTFPEAEPSDPALGGDIGIFYPKVDVRDTSGASQLYFRNALGVLQMTNRFDSESTNGYTMLPGGLIFMWGKILANPGFTDSGTGSTAVVTFPSIANYTGSPAGFPNNLFNVQLTISKADTTNKTLSIDNTATFNKLGFTIVCTVNRAFFNSAYWFAIGN